MRQIQIKWITKGLNGYYELNRLNTSNIKACGVYLIWNSRGVIKVGQSTNIGNRLDDHRNDDNIIRYDFKDNPLLTTWANLPLSALDGVEAYLGDYYQPLIGDRFPDVQKIFVNFP